jgi:hypothetical protein
MANGIPPEHSKLQQVIGLATKAASFPVSTAKFIVDLSKNYPIAGVGICGVVIFSIFSIGQQLGLPPFGIAAVCFGGVVILFLFYFMVEVAKGNTNVKLPAQVLVWVMVVVSSATILLLMSSVFFMFPRPFYQLVEIPGPTTNPGQKLPLKTQIVGLNLSSEDARKSIANQPLEDREKIFWMGKLLTRLEDESITLKKNGDAYVDYFKSNAQTEVIAPTSLVTRSFQNPALEISPIVFAVHNDNYLPVQMSFDPNNIGRMDLPRMDIGDYLIAICLISTQNHSTISDKRHILLEVEK